MTAAPFIPGEYPEYPYWKNGRIIAHQPALPFGTTQPLESEPDESNTDTSTRDTEA